MHVPMNVKFAKVNLSLDKSWSLGGVEVYLHLFSVWIPDGMSGQIHAVAVLAPIKVPPVAIYVI